MTSNMQTPPRTRSAFRIRPKTRRSILLWIVFLPLILAVIIPLIYMTTMAFTLEANQLKFPPDWFPNPITISNFTHIFADKTLPIARWFGNSLLVATVGTLIVVFFSSLSGYAFARLEFPFKNLLFSLLLVGSAHLGTLCIAKEGKACGMRDSCVEVLFGASDIEAWPRKVQKLLDSDRHESRSMPPK